LLKKRIGKEKAYKVANALEKVILIFGRENMGGIEDGRV
jgi:tRNA C32,U32 (ribose-2'-O)-methylase TrmJ